MAENLLTPDSGSTSLTDGVVSAFHRMAVAIGQMRSEMQAVKLDAENMAKALDKAADSADAFTSTVSKSGQGGANHTIQDIIYNLGSRPLT